MGHIATPQLSGSCPAESGLYYLQSRYYDPEIGRFLNADALIATGGLLGNNMFAYCINNPVNCVDSGGCFPCTYQDGGSMLELMNGIVDAGGGGGGGGSLGGPSGWNNGVNIPHLETYSTRNEFIALYYTQERFYGTKTTSLFSGSIDAFSFGTDGGTLLALSASLLSRDVDVGFARIALSDIGNLDVSLSRNSEGFEATAMVSAASTSVSFDIGNSTVTLGGYIGGYGWTAEFSSLSNWKIGAAAPLGGFIAVSKK